MRKDLPEDPSWIRALNRIRHTINTYGHETKPDGELISPIDHFLQDLKSCFWKLPWQFDRTKPILGAIAFVLYDQECSEPPPAYVDEETKVRHLPELNVGWLVNPFKPLIEYMKFRSGAPIDSYASCPYVLIPHCAVRGEEPKAAAEAIAAKYNLIPSQRVSATHLAGVPWVDILLKRSRNMSYFMPTPIPISSRIMSGFTTLWG